MKSAISILVVCLTLVRAHAQSDTLNYVVSVSGTNVLSIDIINRSMDRPLTFFDKNFRNLEGTVNSIDGSKFRGTVELQRCIREGDHWLIDLSDSLFVSSYFDKETNRLLTTYNWVPCYMEPGAHRNYQIKLPRELRDQKIVLILQLNGVKRRFVVHNY